MADRVKKVNYCYMKVPNRPGQGERVLSEIRDSGINLLAYSGFPIGKGKAQLDFVPDDLGALKRLAKKNGWRLSTTKKGFLVTGGDQIGAAHRQIKKLSDAKINITAADAIAAGKKRYGMIIWVKPNQYARAARLLRAN
ncbi:MAG: hypothetical protein OER90_09600 [Gemmatimonadota bacterium]|nr:hypothetical protein [Gemmatimonadota bacterium]